MIELNEPDACYCFSHEAMNTVFTVRIQHADKAQSCDAALACFERLDRIEDALSRYRDGSDVCQINTMQAGQILLIQEDTYRCLLQAFEAYRATGGLFDVTLGKQIDHVKTRAKGALPESHGSLRLLPSRPAIECVEPGRSIDLGGIGKGYALQQMAEVIREWKIGSALLCSGTSTILALGHDTWPVQLTGSRDTRRLLITSLAISASGSAIQGAHLVHPDASFGSVRPRRHTWITARDAAVADAFATAAALMNEADLQRFVETSEVVQQIVIERRSGQLEQLWPIQ